MQKPKSNYTVFIYTSYISTTRHICVTDDMLKKMEGQTLCISASFLKRQFHNFSRHKAVENTAYE